MRSITTVTISSPSIVPSPVPNSLLCSRLEAESRRSASRATSVGRLDSRFIVLYLSKFSKDRASSFSSSYYAQPSDRRAAKTEGSESRSRERFRRGTRGERVVIFPNAPCAFSPDTFLGPLAANLLYEVRRSCFRVWSVRVTRCELFRAVLVITCVFEAIFENYTCFLPLISPARPSSVRWTVAVLSFRAVNFVRPAGLSLICETSPLCVLLLYNTFVFYPRCQHIYIIIIITI